MRRLCTLLVLMLLASVVQAASITTIQLHNRPAVEIIPIVKPMLGANEVITGSGYKLFLRASPQSLEQVRDIIDALDAAAKILQVSVFQGSERDLTPSDATSQASSRSVVPSLVLELIAIRSMRPSFLKGLSSRFALPVVRQRETDSIYTTIRVR